MSTLDECVVSGYHLQSCDDDGYCNSCGHQDNDGDKKTYEVPIVYQGQVNFLVKADSEEEAKEIAESRWKAGVQPDKFGNEWQEIERFGKVSEIKE